MPNIPASTTNDPGTLYKNVLKSQARRLEEEERAREAEREAAEAKLLREKEELETKLREKEELETKRREKEAAEAVFTGKKRQPYMIFSETMRPKIMEENPSLRPTEISKIIAEKWHYLTPEERSKFTEEYALKAREHQLKGLFGGKKQRKTRRSAAKKSAKKHVVRRRRTTRKH